MNGTMGHLGHRVAKYLRLLDRLGRKPCVALVSPLGLSSCLPCWAALSGWAQLPPFHRDQAVVCGAYGALAASPRQRAFVGLWGLPARIDRRQK